MSDAAVVLPKQFLDDLFDMLWLGTKHIRTFTLWSLLLRHDKKKRNRSGLKLLRYPEHRIGIFGGIDQHAMGGMHKPHFESRR
ncbi:Hypothetical protein RG540_PA09200 (plasmid) [Neorhizobium galegae bv. orientalis str. HAMBI 540]|uniref:Uncharacterized protein n=1 Tax=Neorhizobium galegae bv. orientalis str. HAMBI 540 TaxID=1028800 RepID=A0A068T0K2_NEOGA|nr:Hypothetical protein RG540_PA09200 [Neorhizobium galegae bv. orientalis str. HAMBI 540]